MNMKKITSLTMLISGILLLITSIILYIVPHGRVAYWCDWRLWGLSKSQWGDQHINLGFLFLLAACLHIYYNWKLIIAYLKNKARQFKLFTGSFNVALVLTLLVSIGTYFMVPPMSTIINFGESLKEAAAEKYGEPPYGHAELSSFKLFTKKMQIDPVKATELLAAAGVEVRDKNQTIGEIAKANNMTPQQIYEIMKPATKKSENAEEESFPDSPPPGFGKKRLAEICAQYNLHIPKVLSALKKKGIKALPEQSVKEIAGANSMEPMEIFEIIHDVAEDR